MPHRSRQRWVQRASPMTTRRPRRPCGHVQDEGVQRRTSRDSGRRARCVLCQLTIFTPLTTFALYRRRSPPLGRASRHSRWRWCREGPMTLSLSQTMTGVTQYHHTEGRGLTQEWEWQGKSSGYLLCFYLANQTSPLTIVRSYRQQCNPTNDGTALQTTVRLYRPRYSPTNDGPAPSTTLWPHWQHSSMLWSHRRHYGPTDNAAYPPSTVWVHWWETIDLCHSVIWEAVRGLPVTCIVLYIDQYISVTCIILIAVWFISPRVSFIEISAYYLSQYVMLQEYWIIMCNLCDQDRPHA